MSEAVTVPNVMTMTSIVSEESLVRDTHTDTDTDTASSMLSFYQQKRKNPKKSVCM